MVVCGAVMVDRGSVMVARGCYGGGLWVGDGRSWVGDGRSWMLWWWFIPISTKELEESSIQPVSSREESTFPGFY